MATLILQTAGAAVGTALGGPIGGIVGRVVGAAAGSALDGALLGGSATRRVEGPRLSDVAGLSSTEGDPIPRVYGRARIGGTLIWATRPLEVAGTEVERAAGAKGGGGAKTVRTTYAYFADLAIGLCEGPVAGIRRVWADGQELDLTTSPAACTGAGRTRPPIRSSSPRRGRTTPRPIAASPTWCSSAWRSPRSATASRNSPSRCCARWRDSRG